MKGFEQVSGLDYQQVFAAVVRADKFRTLSAIATLLEWDISNVDIDSAFLHGKIDTEVYIELSEGDEKTRRGPINAAHRVLTRRCGQLSKINRSNGPQHQE